MKCPNIWCFGRAKNSECIILLKNEELMECCLVKCCLKDKYEQEFCPTEEEMEAANQEMEDAVDSGEMPF